MPGIYVPLLPFAVPFNNHKVISAYCMLTLISTLCDLTCKQKELSGEFLITV